MKKQKSTASRVIGIILDVILILMALYIVGTLYLRNTTGNPHASIFGVTTHFVATGSMEPNIHEGDIIIVKKSEAYELGDVITYIREDGLSITHRIISVELDGYIVKGDANPEQDRGVVKDEQIVGKVIWKCSLLATG